MPTSAITRQPRDHRARVDAASAANLAAFPQSSLIEGAKPKCRKTADDMRAEMDGWGDKPGINVLTQFANPDYKPRPAKGVAVSAPAVESAPDPDAKPEKTESAPQRALREFRSGGFAHYSEEKRADLANELIPTAAWDTLSVSEKARLADCVTAMWGPDCDVEGNPLSPEASRTHDVQYVQSAHSNEIYQTTYYPTANVVRCSCGSREDCHHIKIRINRDGAAIRARHGKYPQMPSEARGVSHAERIRSIDVSAEQRKADFS